MDAIVVKNQKAYIDEEECVECGICYRSMVCSTSAIFMDKLKWPRIIRQLFSDPTTVHEDTKLLGRGTEEVKTNDITNKIKSGEIGIGIEVGRPCVGTKLKEVDKITTTLAQSKIPVKFEKENPLTNLIKDKKTGELRKDILEERVMSVIIEFKLEIQYFEVLLLLLKKIENDLETVFSLSITTKIEKSEEMYTIPTMDILGKKGIMPYNNGKINVGLGST